MGLTPAKRQASLRRSWCTSSPARSRWLITAPISSPGSKRKLEHHGVAKILPYQDTLMLAYRRSVARRSVASRLRSTIQEAQRHAAAAPVPEDLATLVSAGCAVVGCSHGTRWSTAWRCSASVRMRGRGDAR